LGRATGRDHADRDRARRFSSLEQIDIYRITDYVVNDPSGSAAGTGNLRSKP
jgi:hypothetical protein